MSRSKVVYHEDPRWLYLVACVVISLFSMNSNPDFLFESPVLFALIFVFVFSLALIRAWILLTKIELISAEENYIIVHKVYFFFFRKKKKFRVKDVVFETKYGELNAWLIGKVENKKVMKTEQKEMAVFCEFVNNDSLKELLETDKFLKSNLYPEKK